jgi:hypothetical protein
MKSRIIRDVVVGAAGVVYLISDLFLQRSSPLLAGAIVIFAAYQLIEPRRAKPRL